MYAKLNEINTETLIEQVNLKSTLNLKICEGLIDQKDSCKSYQCYQPKPIIRNDQQKSKKRGDNFLDVI